MGRHTGSACKQCRREGTKLYLKGERCSSQKCSFAKRSYPPGQHGQGKKRVSEFGIRLREKQKARSVYGLGERQFRNYFETAAKSKSSTGDKMLELLERRLDNVVWRMGLSTSRQMARQFVRNGHIVVNGKKVNIPSFSVKEGTVVDVKISNKELFAQLVEKTKERNVPGWISFDPQTLQGKIMAMPKRSDIESLIDERLIVEFYSR